MESIHPQPPQDTEPGDGFDPLSFPAGYANDVVEHVIAHNCGGCVVPSAASIAEFGPGGSCGFLASIYVSRDIPWMSYDGTVVTCHRRVG